MEIIIVPEMANSKKDRGRVLGGSGAGVIGPPNSTLVAKDVQGDPVAGRSRGFSAAS
jgi:hypothetical protein